MPAIMNFVMVRIVRPGFASLGAEQRAARARVNPAVNGKLPVNRIHSHSIVPGGFEV